MLTQLDPKFWHKRAEDARALAEEMHDPNSRAIMLQIARMYGGMVLRTEERLAKQQAANYLAEPRRRRTRPSASLVELAPWLLAAAWEADWAETFTALVRR